MNADQLGIDCGSRRVSFRPEAMLYALLLAWSTIRRNSARISKIS